MNLLKLQAFDIDVWRTTGTKVRTVDGQDVKQLTLFEVDGGTVLYGVVGDSEIRSWSVNGVSFNQTRLNLMMEVPQVKMYVGVYYNKYTQDMWCGDIHNTKHKCTEIPLHPHIRIIDVLEFELNGDIPIKGISC